MKRKLPPLDIEIRPFSVSEIVSLRQLQDDYISWVIETCGNDPKEAASKMGISPRTIYNRIKFGNVKTIDI